MNLPAVLLLAALLTGWLGFGVLANMSARCAKVLCVVFLAAFAYTMHQHGAGW